MGKFVAYYRVSTTKQGIDGLGMDGQKAAVDAFLKGGGGELVGEFAEVESGARNERPELQKAIALCRRAKGRLVIARLDRLARNAAFLLGLRDAGVDFVCCDYPNADKFTVGILAVLAEKERDLISERTKAGLAAAKRRGARLGNPQLAKARKHAAQRTRERASAFAAKLAPVVEEIRSKGRVEDLGQIAECLNARGCRTARGKQFTLRSVKRLLRRIAG